jgi:hypothetical protein
MVAMQSGKRNGRFGVPPSGGMSMPSKGGTPNQKQSAAPLEVNGFFDLLFERHQLARPR